MGTTYAPRPSEVVSIDLVGPLTRSSLGNTVLLVRQDTNLKWAGIKPMNAAKAEKVTQISKEVTSLYGKAGSSWEDDDYQEQKTWDEYEEGELLDEHEIPGYCQPVQPIRYDGGPAIVVPWKNGYWKTRSKGKRTKMKDGSTELVKKFPYKKVEKKLRK